MNRRSFLIRSNSLVLGTAALSLGFHAGERFTTGLSQYSLRALLKSGALDPLDFPQFALDEFGIKAIDFWDGGLPKDKIDSPGYLEKIKTKSEQIGSDLFLFMAPTYNIHPDKVEASRRAMLKNLERSRRIGARYMRIFLRVPGEDMDSGVRASVEALKPLSDLAAERKVMLVIEPGNSSLSVQGGFLARVAKELNHPACRLMPDFGKLKGDIYEGTKAMMPYTETVSCKMHSFDSAGGQPDFDYPRLMEIISRSSYRGILAIEWEGKNLKPIEGVKASQALLQRSLSKA